MKKRDPYKIFFDVVRALLLREIQTRFGTKKLGYLWAVLDPISTILVFSIIKELLHSKAMQGISYPVFLTSSLIAYYMFKNIATKSMSAFEANKGLFVYKQVKPFDTLVSRYILEIFISGVVFTILLFIGWYIGLDVECKNILGVILAYIWISIFGFSLGIFFAVVGFFYENFKKIISMLFLPLFFLSALFYTIDSLPPIVREILLYNPLVHFMEMIHGNYFYPLNTNYVDYGYMLLWTLLPLYFGLWLYRKSYRKIIMS